MTGTRTATGRSTRCECECECAACPDTPERKGNPSQLLEVTFRGRSGACVAARGVSRSSELQWMHKNDPNFLTLLASWGLKKRRSVCSLPRGPREPPVVERKKWLKSFSFARAPPWPSMRGYMQMSNINMLFVILSLARCSLAAWRPLAHRPHGRAPKAPLFFLATETHRAVRRNL